MLGGCPGISIDAAKWLAAQGVVAVGADQASVEVWPAERPGEDFSVHIELLAKSGVYLIEQAQLEEIARERVYEFLLICATPEVRRSDRRPRPAASGRLRRPKTSARLRSSTRSTLPFGSCGMASSSSKRFGTL